MAVRDPILPVYFFNFPKQATRTCSKPLPKCPSYLHQVQTAPSHTFSTRNFHCSYHMTPWTKTKISKVKMFIGPNTSPTSHWSLQKVIWSLLNSHFNDYSNAGSTFSTRNFQYSYHMTPWPKIKISKINKFVGPNTSPASHRSLQ